MSAISIDSMPSHPPDQLRALRQQHGIILGLALAVMALSYAFTTVDTERIAVTGFSQLPLPTICQSRLWLKLDCPGCGLTRSFIHFFHGRWQDSFTMHRLGWLLATLTILQIPYRVYALATPHGLPLGKVFPQSIGYGLIALLAINWLLKFAGA